MRMSDTSELLQWLSGVDKRKVDDQTILSWHEVIGHLDFKDARMALVSARQDESINYLEPKDILRHHKIIKARVEREARIVDATRPIEAPRRPPGGKTGDAPKPNNWTELCAAYDSGDQVAVNREIAIYKGQLRDAGFSTDWTPAPCLT